MQEKIKSLETENKDLKKRVNDLWAEKQQLKERAVVLEDTVDKFIEKLTE